MTTTRRLLLLPLLAASLATCRLDMLLGGGSANAGPSLLVLPTSIEDSARAGSDDSRRVTIEIRNGGSGASFAWVAEEDHSWVRLSPREGTVPDTLTITLDPEDLDPGTHEGAITITASGAAVADSEVTIAVTFHAQRAGLVVTPGSITRETMVNSGATFSETLRIANDGTGPLEWTADNDRSWVTLGRKSGTGAGELPVTINTSGLSAGTHRDEIVVSAPGATGSPARIDVTVRILAPGLAVSPGSIADTMAFGSTTAATHRLRVTNSGTGSLTWTTTKRAPWVAVSPSGGGAPADVDVTLNPTGLPPGTHRDTVVFTSPEATNDPVRVPVELAITQATLTVTPAQISDAAAEGETTARVHTLTVSNGGGVFAWTAGSNRPWIGVSPASGVAPPSSSITVTLDPRGLPAGTHTGAVTVSAPTVAGSPVTIPVTFTISGGCGITRQITPDDVASGSLGGGDCAAPHRPGSLADLYAVLVTAGDTLSLRLTAQFDAYLILTDGSAATVLAQNNECPGESRTACIRDFHVPASGSYLVEVTSAGAGETGSYALTATRERPPGEAQNLGQFKLNGNTPIPVGGTTDEDGVVLKGTINDPNPRDSVRLEIELRPLSAGLTGVPTHSGGFVPASGGNGTTVQLTASGLTHNTAYHWQARACDRTGRCSAWQRFGGNQESDPDFSVAFSQNPTLGTLGQFQSDGVTAIALGGRAAGRTVVLAATVHDADAGDVLRLEVEVRETDDDFEEKNLLVASELASGGEGRVRFDDVNEDEPYHWRARVCDQTQRCSPWSSFPQPNPNPESQPDFRGPEDDD